VTGEALGLLGVAFLLLLSSLQVVLARNLFHSVLWLALALVSTAGLFLLLQAEFLAAAQVLLYAGGVVTIVVFAIMLTERLVGESLQQMNRGIGWGAAVAAAVFVAVALVLLRAPLPAPPAGAGGAVTTDLLGRALLTDWVLPFEVLGVLLLAALLAAVHVARTED
jgi:NADH:ubiquinone oxidoreductase subunit 6 (subunit J)